jgi:hypothetical protein
MPITLGTALTAIRERLDERTERQWSDIELRRWLNEGAKDAARRSFALMDSATITLIAGTSEYTVPSNVLQIYTVEWLPTDGRHVVLQARVREALPSMPYQDTNSGDPCLYTTWGFPPTLKLKLFPSPYAAGSLKLFVSRLPTALSLTGSDDATAIDFPEGWVEIIFDYCEYRALRVDKDPRWQESQGLYMDNLKEMIQSADSYLRENGEFVDGSMGPYDKYNWGW